MVRAAGRTSVILAVATTALVVLSASATKARCGFAVDQLRRGNPAFADASTAMWDVFERSCADVGGCRREHDPVSAETRIDFSPLRNTPHYEEVRAACRALGTEDAPTSLCHVNTRLEVTDGSGDGGDVVVDRLFARREPACFPGACDVGQTATVDPRPLGCDPDRTDCVVARRTASCGADRLTTTTTAATAVGGAEGACRDAAEVVARDARWREAVGALHADAGAECVEHDPPHGDAVCASSTEPVGMTVATDLRPFEHGTEYRAYEDACFNAGGELCRMSLAARIKGDVDGFFTIDLSGDYNDHPLCFPADCADVDDRVEVHKETIGRDLNQRVTDMMQGNGRRRRRLNRGSLWSSLSPMTTSDFDVEHPDARTLQINENYCPVRGMDTCTMLVSDFYCTKRGDRFARSASSTKIISALITAVAAFLAVASLL